MNDTYRLILTVQYRTSHLDSGFDPFVSRAQVYDVLVDEWALGELPKFDELDDIAETARQKLEAPRVNSHLRVNVVADKLLAPGECTTDEGIIGALIERGLAEPYERAQYTPIKISMFCQ